MMDIYGEGFARVYNKDWAFWADHVWPLISRVVEQHVPGGRKWLDLCCGTGSLLTRVCEEGYEVTGLDVSPHQLAHAAENAPGATLVEGDVRDLDLGRTFDVITCLFDSLNYLTDPNDLARVFARVREHLADPGCFIFDVNTYEGLHDVWNRTSAIHDPDHVVVVESSFDDESALGRARMTGFVREGELYRRFQEEHVERGYRAAEIEGMLADAGFAFDKYDGHSLEEPGERPGRLLYACKVRR